MIICLNFFLSSPLGTIQYDLLITPDAIQIKATYSNVVFSCHVVGYDVTSGLLDDIYWKSPDGVRIPTTGDR